ncbi:hypothetical protein T492DRAFT_912748, partial [Pavlovales sp. CCMP2436]
MAPPHTECVCAQCKDASSKRNEKRSLELAMKRINEAWGTTRLAVHVLLQEHYEREDRKADVRQIALRATAAERSGSMPRRARALDELVHELRDSLACAEGLGVEPLCRIANVRQWHAEALAKVARAAERTPSGGVFRQYAAEISSAELDEHAALTLYALYHLECMVHVLSGRAEDHASPFATCLHFFDPAFRVHGVCCDILARALSLEAGAGFAPVLSEYADAEEELAARLDGWSIAHAAAARAFTERVELLVDGGLAARGVLDARSAVSELPVAVLPTCGSKSCRCRDSESAKTRPCESYDAAYKLRWRLGRVVDEPAGVGAAFKTLALETGRVLYEVIRWVLVHMISSVFLSIAYNRIVSERAPSFQVRLEGHAKRRALARTKADE